MASSPTILDSDFRYIDKKGNLLKTRTELTVAQMLTFLEQEYEYNHKITLKNGNEIAIDFKTEKGLVLFDLGSAVDLRHPNTREFLKRDINNITRFFSKRGIPVDDPQKVLEEIMP